MILDWDYCRANFLKHSYPNKLANKLGMKKLEL